MNLLPGQGLGFTASKLMAFGLGAMTVQEVPIPPSYPVFGGGGWFGGQVMLHDNAYSRKADEAEIVELLSILFQVIE
jgi:hypothetical protein